MSRTQSTHLCANPFRECCNLDVKYHPPPHPHTIAIRLLSRYLVPSYQYCSGRLGHLWDCSLARSGLWKVGLGWLFTSDPDELTVSWSEKMWGASATGSQYHAFSTTIGYIPLHCKVPKLLSQLFCYSDKNWLLIYDYTQKCHLVSYLGTF